MTGGTSALAVSASRPRCRDRGIGPCAPLTAELPAGSWRPVAPASPCRPHRTPGAAPAPDNEGRIRSSAVVSSPASSRLTIQARRPPAPLQPWRQGAHVMTGSASTSRSSIAPSAVIAWRSRLRPMAQSMRPSAQSTRPAARPSAGARSTRSRGCRSSRAATPPPVHGVPRAVRKEQRHLGRSVVAPWLLPREGGIYLSQVGPRHGLSLAGAAVERIGSVGLGRPGRGLTIRLRYVIGSARMACSSSR
jgi:hypothetical protein